MKWNPERTAKLALCCACLTRVSQAAAAAAVAAVARIAGKPDILQAAGSGDFALVQDHLIANASCVNGANEFLQQTPLHVSAEKGHADVSSLLISSKAEVNSRNEK